MMDSGVAALIGAGIGFAGSLVQKALDLKTEPDKWRRSRQDVVYRDICLAAGDLATKIAELATSTMLFTYKVDSSNRADWKKLKGVYDLQSHSLIAALKGAEVRLVTMDAVLRDSFKQLVGEVIDLSEHADEAFASLRSGEGDKLISQEEVNQETLTFIKVLPHKIGNLLDEKSAVSRG